MTSVMTYCDVSVIDWLQTLMFPGQKAESRVHVTEDGTLSIQSARVEDSGEYSCQALNAAGSSFANAHITVIGMSLALCLHVCLSLSLCVCVCVPLYISPSASLSSLVCPINSLIKCFGEFIWVLAINCSQCEFVAYRAAKYYYDNLYSPDYIIHHHVAYVNVMLSNITFLWFLQFLDAWLLTQWINCSLYHLYFLSVTVHFIALRLGGSLCIRTLNFCWN